MNDWHRNKSVSFQERGQITAVDTAQNSNNTTVGKQARGLNEVSLSASLQIPCTSPLHRLVKLLFHGLSSSLELKTMFANASDSTDAPRRVRQGVFGAMYLPCVDCPGKRWTESGSKSRFRGDALLEGDMGSGE